MPCLAQRKAKYVPPRLGMQTGRLKRVRSSCLPSGERMPPRRLSGGAGGERLNGRWGTLQGPLTMTMSHVGLWPLAAWSNNRKATRTAMRIALVARRMLTTPVERRLRAIVIGLRGPIRSARRTGRTSGPFHRRKPAARCRYDSFVASAARAINADTGAAS